jgi:RNA polymerase sigma factor (sigma-70 family)
VSDRVDAAEQWRQTYMRTRPTLLRALAAAVGTFDGVEDAVQDAFIKALEHQPSDISSIDGWLFTVALNSLRRRYRKARVTRLFNAPDHSGPSDLDGALVRLDVVAVLGKLKPRERELLIGKYYIGMSQEELARLCRVSRGTVASAVSRAAARFREVDHGQG